MLDSDVGIVLINAALPIHSYISNLSSSSAMDSIVLQKCCPDP